MFSRLGYKINFYTHFTMNLATIQQHNNTQLIQRYNNTQVIQQYNTAIQQYTSNK